jgi:hypothetical protein
MAPEKKRIERVRMIKPPEKKQEGRTVPQFQFNGSKEMEQVEMEGQEILGGTGGPARL